MMRTSLTHVVTTYLLCGLTCFVVYLLKWPKNGAYETENNHIYYSFWQLLGLVSQMLIISGALVICITYDEIKRNEFRLSRGQRNLLTVVGVVNVFGGVVNLTTGLNRAMAATFLLPTNDQLALYILPISVTVIQIIVSVILILEVKTWSGADYVEIIHKDIDVDTFDFSLLESTLANSGVPYVILMPDSLKPKPKAQY